MVVGLPVSQETWCAATPDTMHGNISRGSKSLCGLHGMFPLGGTWTGLEEEQDFAQRSTFPLIFVVACRVLWCCACMAISIQNALLPGDCKLHGHQFQLHSHTTTSFKHPGSRTKYINMGDTPYRLKVMSSNLIYKPQNTSQATKESKTVLFFR